MFGWSLLSVLSYFVGCLYYAIGCFDLSYVLFSCDYFRIVLVTCVNCVNLVFVFVVVGLFIH